MKIAFIGTHGVGKTTLCYELAAALKREGVHVDIVKEVARLSPLPINQKTSLEAQTWIFLTQMAEEIRSGSQHDVLVCDRSVLDNYAYLVLACGRQPSIERYMQHWMRSYDLLFKVPFEGQMADDGVRDTDAFFAAAVDQMVDKLLSERSLTHERLEPGKRDTWIQRVKQVVLAHPQGQRRLI